MTIATDLRDLVAARLRAGVPAVSGRVYVERREFPMQTAGQGGAAQFPCILVYEDQTVRTSTSGNNGSPSFETTLTLDILAGVEVRTPAEVKPALDALAAAIDAALLSDPTLPSAVSAIPRMTITRTSNAAGERILASLGVKMDLQFGEDFPPVIEDALESVHITVDAIDPFDPLGDYGPIDDFPAPEDPPRTQGPDGRAEAVLTVTLPTA